MKARLKQLIFHPLLQGSFLLMMATTIANINAFLYHAISANILKPEQYGLLQSYISLTYFLVVFSGGLTLSIINIFTNLEENSIWVIVKKIEKYFLRISFFSWIIILLLFPFFKNFFNFKDFPVFFIFSLFALFLLPSILYVTVLQSRLKFWDFSILTLLRSFFLVIISFLLLIFFKNTGSALLGQILTFILIIYFSRMNVEKYWNHLKQKKTAIKINLKKDFFQYSLLTIGVSLPFISIFSTDILLTRHYFSETLTGIYAAASLLGKIIFFTNNAVLMVVFPLFIKFKERKMRLQQTFWLAFLIIAGVCFSGLIFYKLFPSFTISILYGKKYQETLPLLFLMAIFMVSYSFFNLFVQFLLALNKKISLIIACFVALLQILLISLNHTDLKQIIINSIISLSFGLVISLFFNLKYLYETRK